MNVFKPLATLGAASVLAFAVQSAQAGPTIEFGDEGFVQINYALQLWSQQRSYTNGNDDGSSFDTFLRRNRITLFGQKNDLVGFYAQLEAGGDSRGGDDECSAYYCDAYFCLDDSRVIQF